MDFFMLDAGTSTVSCLALFALRMRVSISAMGSVICMSLYLLFDYRPLGEPVQAARYRRAGRPFDLLTAFVPLALFIKTAVPRRV